MGLVGVELRAGRVADDLQPIGDPQPPVARIRRPAADVEAVVLQAQVVERELAADREQDRVTLRRRAIVEVDDVGAVRPTPARAATARTPVLTVDPVVARAPPDHLGVARVIGRGEARPGLDDDVGHAEPGVDLGELAAGRTATEDDQAARQLAGQRRLLVGPTSMPSMPGRRWGDFETEPTATTTSRAGQLVACAVVRTLDPSAVDDPASPR